jgi:hypothetical protein
MAASAFFWWVARAAWKSPVFFLASIFLFWQFALKVVATLVLDVLGPINSQDINVMMGGGSSAVLMVASVWLPLAILYLALKPGKREKAPLPEKNLERGGVTFADAMYAVFCVYLFLLFADLIRIGNIPIIAHLDRFEYKGGVFHYLLFNYNWMITFLLGFVFARSRIVTGAWDVRFLWILGALFFYSFLTGNRFGAFYVMLSFVSTGIAGFWYAKKQGWAAAADESRITRAQAFVTSRRGIAMLATAGGLLVSAALINNFLFVRNYGSESGNQLVQRLFVQPVELYWMTWDRVERGETISTSEAMNFLFNDPLDPTRNTGIQYLMLLSLGEQTANYQFVEQGQDYAGGYPEILIELGGLGIAFAAAAAISIIVALLYRLTIVAIARGHFFTSVTAFYVCYMVLAVFLGGMLNFVLAWLYWVKFAMLIVSLVLDRFLEAKGLRLVPWVLIPARRRVSSAPLLPAS